MDLGQRMDPALADVFLAVYDDCVHSAPRKEKTAAAFVTVFHEKAEAIRESRESIEDYEKIKAIGSGAFSVVYLARDRKRGEHVALKVFSKWEMLRRQESACFRAERELLAKVTNIRCPWTCQLRSAFQDDDFLYLVMDFQPGGDLRGWLARLDSSEDVPEETVRFYVAELVLAVEAIHALHFAHRDIKPDNILIGRDGHIRLADFGSCVEVDRDGLIHATTAVGTPDYISCETLKALESKTPYTRQCDYWSIGVVLYELLYGETPFYAESLLDTYHRIQTCEFAFPLEPARSEPVKDLVRRLCCPPEERIASIEQLKQHPFFNGIDWDALASRGSAGKYS